MDNENELWKSFPDALKEWMSSDHRSFADDDLDADIIKEVSPWIASGRVIVENENQSRFDLLEKKYPIGLNRIDWRGVQPHHSADILHIADGQEVGFEAHVERLLASRDVICDLLAKCDISREESVIWIGDDCQLSLHMIVETLLECYVALFASPQHSYVVSDDGTWCLNYTLEGQLFVGRAANAVATGAVDLESFLN